MLQQSICGVVGKDYMAEIQAKKTTKFAVLELKQNILSSSNNTSSETQVKSSVPPPVKSSASVPPPVAAVAPPPATSSSIDVETLILQTLAKENVILDSWDFALRYSLDHQIVVGNIKSLLVDNYIKDEAKSTTLWLLSDEGQSILNSGSLEYQVFQAVPSQGITMDELNQILGENIVKIGLGPCMKNKWVKKDKNLIIRLMDNVYDETAEQLRQLASGGVLSEDDLKNLKKRKLVNQQVRKSYRIEKGEEFSERRQKRCADITREMLGNPEEVRLDIL